MQFLILLQPCGESFPKDTPAFHCFYFSNRFICNFEKGLLFFPPLKTVLPECWAKQMLWKGIPAAFQTENTPIHIVLKYVGVWLWYT